jgi:hypothetical protein
MLRGKEAAARELPFSLAPLGAQSYTVPPIAPAVSGNYSLQVAAAAEDDSAHPTLSHRDVFVREDPTDK